MITAMQTVNGL